MSFKRARLEEQLETNHPEALEQSSKLEGAAKKFRLLLIERYLEGSASAADTSQLAYFHVESGGQGAEDLALDPRCATRHAAEHLRSWGG